MRVVEFHRTPLSRQTAEAVRIMKRGGAGAVLNSKSEYNRCYIPRLRMVEEDVAKELELAEEEELSQISEELNRIEDEWSRSKNKARSKQSLGRKIGSTGGKRQGAINDNKQGGRRPKKMKYGLLDRDWGTKTTGEPSYKEQEEHNILGESTPMEQAHIPPPRDTQLPNTLPPKSQAPNIPSTQVSPDKPSNPDDSSLHLESFAQGLPPVQVAPSVEYLHEGHLGEVTKGWGSDLTPPPPPHYA